jgi:6-phosphofructokinase 1
MVGIHGGFPGLLNDEVEDMTWAAVEGLAGFGGAQLGTSRSTPRTEDYALVGEAIQRNRIDGLLVVGGHRAYEAVWRLRSRRADHPGLQVPLICLPASIDNNLPGWEMTIGADTALNVIVTCVDAIKQSASASHRAFVVETMGRKCGFLAALAGLSVGAEEVYLNEDPPTLSRLNRDVAEMVSGFRQGRSFHLSIRNEQASTGYTTEFLRQLFTEESHGLFDVRTSVLGHLQQGANPTAFDRAHAASLAAHCIDWLTGRMLAGRSDWHYLALKDGKLGSARIVKLPEVFDMENRRPKQQWWMPLLGVMDELSKRPAEHSEQGGGTR